MAIDSITAGGYNDTANRVSKDPVYSAGTPVKQGPITAATAGTQVPAAIYKDKEADGPQSDTTGKNPDEAARQIKATISEANFKATRTRCEYSVDDKTNRISIKMIDETTNEVIKEIPPEKSLEMLAKVWELAGILVDEKR
ncbi:flagellar protein FlaG [Anaerocolumna xylanovorans]|uniref:Flagellar protein FlaG n=1 Tax=Anaerocolumna xylanovorans DSM 12503 TaxID=1121345 RepID=A0A1M7Y808_9FIRM|nr:flagellar protein FlaG [Anaerocolumna xylanovorans]SHO48750.1 flagellar protein FlaG [Anaerocolumna xylanovorans DSM 12503]